jgi:hypothetical protein
VIRKALLAAFAFGALAPGLLVGQRLEKPLPHWEPLLQGSDTVPKAPPVRDYSWEGLAIGGAFVGILGAVAGSGFCGYDDSASKPNCTVASIKGFLIGATIGGVTGGLLGSLIHKPPPDDPEHP